MELKKEFTVELTDNDIDDIMSTALEGGITYWCDEARVVGDYLGEYASDQISKGGQLILCDYESEEEHLLTKEKFIEGFKKCLDEDNCPNFLEQIDKKLVVDTCYIDAEIADMIIQLALFGEVVYG